MTRILQECNPHLSVFFVLPGCVHFGEMLAYHGEVQENCGRTVVSISVHINGAYDKKVDERNLYFEDNPTPGDLMFRFQTFCRDDAERRVAEKAEQD